ncbi:DIS3-like exonuclease 1-like protein [Cokeromyces recurvatus]|uniref:DIS3-like exonuclease 1-like protein n=1 Tax=Cokeromyces recurvatus TaxID=90255 RepID=UPI0022201AC9|nr:DIS3-like exonuclease 1-like protein [Cokeromyces recurvatus]KAI7902436.1 DIS3-like exonuclease 1-like protein [Cokeromyces recurvatus]
MVIKTDRAFYKKTRSNAIIKLVREQYVRTDIPCLSEECPSHCQNDQQQTLLSGDHYIIPDISVIMRYLEILEQEEVTGIIFSQTVTMNLQQHDKLKTYRKLRQIMNDSRRKSVMFYNEIFKDTKIARMPDETSADRDWRALCQLARWYSAHLHHQKKIILLSEVHHAETNDVNVMTTKEYLDLYWKDNSLLQNLVHVLADVVLEDNNEDGKIRLSLKLSHGSSTTAVHGYTEYKPIDELEIGIKSSRYYSGILRCKKDNRDQAYVTGSGYLGKDILIIGNENRNRSVHGDLVVVELLSETNWTTLSNDISFDTSNTEDEYEENRLKNSITTATQPTGRVVGVLNRNWRSYVATLQEDSSEIGGSIHLAIPLDPVIPKIRIKYQDVKLIENQRIVVRIDNWPIHSQYPNGHFVRSLGPIHQLDTEISAILVEHSISVSQASQGFSEMSLKEMPIDTTENPWTPEKDEILQRRDLRNLTVFSIDPPNCQDIDDALSIKELDDGKIELGVHIADVSYFVKENYITDLEAKSRGTTVYLADRRFDMLPSVLSERVCSLRHKVDRYAVSVIWTLNKDYQILDTWFGRSIIRSSCEMEYEQAQQLLDGKSVATGLDSILCKKLKPCIIKLAEVLRVMRERRLAKGALELEGSEVKFKITDQHEITDIIPKHSLEIHGLVAEAMILANASVGKRIYEGFKESAILRHHPPPTKSQFEGLVKAAKSRGFSIDFSSNKTLAQSLEEISRGCKDDPEIARLLKTMATVAMNEAGYISSGHYPAYEYYHYGLALEFYTHFTSPIRRYADIIAHRQLLTCVQDPTAIKDNHDRGSVMFKDASIASICENLNLKSRESKFAQRDSTELFQSLYVLQHTSNDTSLIERGVISEIRSNGFYVFVPRLGLKGPVYLKDKNGEPSVPLSLITGKETKDENETIPNCRIEIDMPNSISVHSTDLPNPIQFNLFDHVQVSLKLRKSHAHRHMVYMTLVDFEHIELASTKLVRMTNTEMLHAIEEEEEEKKKPTEQSKKKKKSSSMYELLEKFRKLSIIESKAVIEL